MKDWNAKHVVVTGGASGIGAACVDLLKAHGATVTVIDINPPDDIADHWTKADLNDLSSIPPITVSGGIDALINAAGLPPRAGREAETLRVNYFALVALTTQLATQIKQGGAIVSMASRAGAQWKCNFAQIQRLNSTDPLLDLADFIENEGVDPVRAYDLSKEAVIAWTKDMVAPMREKNLRINSVSPAAVETPILNEFMTSLGARAERGLEMTGRAGHATEVAETLLFLISPKASWITGCNIECDGGLTAELEISALRFSLTSR
ncbi:MAG: SDR family oxidoreductase [Boseongicola sp.]|nr:SDR family oxidoreductase [Boseongicola sp.]NNJ67340.1 SDR family oxidoreductase [Boseongicola sp.]